MESETLIDEVLPVRANDRISLRFIENDHTKATIVSPTFTHQLFDDEKVVLTSDTHAYINISLTSLHSEIDFQNTYSDEDCKTLLSKLSKTLVPPYGCSYLPTLPESCLIDTFTENEDQYMLYLVSHNDANATDIFQKAEQLAIWFIETASTIDFSDDKWEALLLLKKRPIDTQCIFVGYYTLFTFHNPVKGSKIRVCQALVLPPFQGKGLGRYMLLQVYRLAAKRDYVVEVTVEDPAPGFQRLRDAVDVEWLLSNRNTGVPAADCSVKLTCAQMIFAQFCVEYKAKFFAKSSDAGMASEDFFVGTKRPHSLTMATVDFSASGVSTGESSNGDVLRVHKSSSGPVVEQNLKSFRLAVKKHLLATHGELKGLSKTDMQRELGILYSEIEDRFKAVCCKEWVWQQHLAT